MARTFLEVDGITDVAGDGTEIFGQTGNEKVTLLDGYTGFVLDQNIEEVGFQGNYADYTFEQQGINLNVKNSAGDVMATIAVQNDDNGTQFTFADGTVDVVFDGTTIVVGDEPVDPADIGKTFTLQEIEAIPEETEPVLYWGYTPNEERQGGNQNLADASQGIPASELIDFLQDINIDLVQLGVIDDDGVDPSSVIENITINDLNNNTASVTITTTDGQTTSAEASLGEDYLDFLSDLIYYTATEYVLDPNGAVVVDGNGDPVTHEVMHSRLYMVDEVTQEAIPGSAIVLTPSENNGGTFEDGTTSNDNDLIVAGRLDLLHGAYIDGGDGYDILEVDAKGVYAQPLELLNIEEVRVENLPNVYTDGSDDDTYPDLSGTGQKNSILDLSRATGIERVVVTEGDFDDLTGSNLGSLTLAGIRNGAWTTLDGGFTQEVTLHYSEESNYEGLNLEFLNLSMEAGALLDVAHNADTLNIYSHGAGNYLNDPDLGGSLSNLNIYGDAHLYIEGDLKSSFHSDSPVTIDASQNTGGVNLNLSGTQNVTFLGTSADDRFLVETAETAGLYTNDQTVTIVGNGGDNHYEVATYSADITALDGDNNFEISSLEATVTVGDGNNHFELNDTYYFTGTAGDGDNVVVSASDSETFEFTAGSGNNAIFVNSMFGDGAEFLNTVNINLGDGNNSIVASGFEIQVATGAGDDNLTIFGTDDDSDAAAGDLNDQLVLLNIDLGAGQNTLNFGYEEDYFAGHDVDWANLTAVGITARTGSVITGENISLYVDNNSDISQADISSGSITSVTLDGSADLKLSAADFSDIGAGNFFVENAAFGESATLTIVVTEDISLTDLGVDDLSSSIDLKFEVADEVTLEMTAQQLHEKVAENGVYIADDNNDDLAPGEVYITDAGNDFDPYDEGDLSEGGSLLMITPPPGGPGVPVVPVLGITSRIEQSPDGYERPDQTQVELSRWLHNSDEDGAQITADASTADLLLLEGDADLTMVPVPGGIDGWGVETEAVTAIEMDSEEGNDDGFYIDFSNLNGQLIDLTLARFNDVAAVYGNGNDARLNVELEGDVGDAAEGLVSSGVATYVVTDINDLSDDDGDADATTATFWTCETTQGLVTLGLQGNYGNTVTFGNTELGVNFLMEAVYDKANGSAVVGTLNGVYAREGADAVVNITNPTGSLADGDAIMVDGITLDNAADVTINVAGGDALIEAIELNDDADNLTLTSADDVTLQVTNDELNALTTLDATGVVGDMVLAVAGTIADLSELTALEDIDQVILANLAEFALTAEQATVIGSENFFIEEGDTATLTLTGLSDQPFSRDDFDEDITVTVELADEEEITLHPDTDLTDVGVLTVGPDTTLTLDGDQLVQLVTTGGTLNGTGRVVVSDFNQTHMDAMGEWAAAQDLAFDFDDAFAATLDRVTLNVDGDLELGEYEGSDSVDRSVEIDAGLKDALSFEMNEGQLTLATVDQADYLLVNDGNVKFTFFAAGTSIDMAGYTNIGEVEVYALLINNNDNIEDLFLNLASSIQDLENVIRVVDTPVGLSLDRAVIVDPGVTTEWDMQFITADDAVHTENIGNVWVNLAGGSTIDGSIVLDANTAKTGTFDTLTIVSFGDEANTITGGIMADGTAGTDTDDTDPAGVDTTVENNLLNVVIDAAADLVIEGAIVFQSVTGDEAAATLTLSGEGNVTLTGLDATTDLDDGNGGVPDIKSLTIDMTDLNGDLILARTNIDYDFTDIDDLTIIGNSADNPIVLGENVTLELTAEQANGLFIVPAADADVETITVDIIDLENDVTYDFSNIDADIAGTIELDTTAAPAGADGRVQLEDGTDLGDFTVHLYDDQLIGFMTAEQANGQAVTTENDTAANNGNIAWLFEGLLPSAIDASGYAGSIERLFINDELANDNAGEVEDLWSGLAPGIETVNIRYTGDLDFDVTPTDRTFEVSGFADLTSGLELLQGEDAQYYENVTIKLGGGADIESLTLNNFVDPTLAEDGQDFHTLTIQSGRFDTDAEFDPITNVFAPDNWDPEGDFAVPTENTIGDISSGTDLRLVKVTLETENLTPVNDINDNDGELALNVGIITFDGDTDAAGDPIEATLTLTGGEDITIEGLEAGENINSIAMNVADFSGTVTITGGSPAIFGDGLERFVLVGDGYVDPNYATINIGLDDNDEFPGIDSDALTEFDASSFEGTLNLQLSDVNNDEFTFTAGTGVTTLTLDGDMELADGGVWVFDFTKAPGTSELVITDEVVFGDGTLTITNNVDVVVPAGNTVTLSAAQADGLTITGAGDVVITDLEDTPDADLGGIMTGMGDTGTVAAQLDSTGDVDLTAADLGVAQVTITGNGVVDATGATIAPVDRNDPATDGGAGALPNDFSDDTLPSFVVGTGATVQITAAQAGEWVENDPANDADDWALTATGAGTVAVDDLSLNAAANLSGLATTTVTADVDNFVTFTGDLGTADVTLTADAVNLTADIAVLDGATIGYDMTVGAVAYGATVTVLGATLEADAIGGDLSNITARNIVFDAAGFFGALTFPTLATDTIDGTEYPQSVEMTATQADGQTIGGEGAVALTYAATADNTLDIDLSGITATDPDDDGTPAFDPDNLALALSGATFTTTLAAGADLGNMDLTIAASHTVSATGTQIDGLGITGAGTLELTSVSAGVDLSNISGVTVTVVVEDGASADLSAIDGLTVIDIDPTDAGTDNDADITLSADQFGALHDTGNGTNDTKADLTEIDTLTVDETYTIGLDDFPADLTVEYDAVADEITVSGAAYGIVQAQVTDDTDGNAFTTNILSAATTIEHTQIGGFTSYDSGADGIAGVKDIFEYATSSKFSTAITTFVSANGDKVDIRVFGDANSASLDLTAGTITATVNDNDVQFAGGGAAGDADTAGASAIFLNGRFTALTETGTTAYYVVADDDSSAIYKYNQVTNDSAIATNELTLIGTVDAALVLTDIMA